MYSHEVAYSYRDCPGSAAYKIACRWTDGQFSELKTFGFACSDHLGQVFGEAQARMLDDILSPGETLEELAIYRLENGRRDRQLQRLWGLEENYRT